MGIFSFTAKAVIGTIATGNPVAGVGIAAITEGASNALENDGHPEGAAGLRLGLGSVEDIATAGIDVDRDD